MASFRSDERITASAIKERYDLRGLKTVKHVTDFEKALAVGARSENLSRGWPTTLDAAELAGVGGAADEIKVAQEEYRLFKMPFWVKRNLEDGTVEVVDINDLERVSR